MTGPDDSTPAPTAPVRPRIRTAAVVWGLLIAAIAAAIGWFVLDPERVTATGLALVTSAPRTLAIGGVGLVVAVGAVILIGSLLSVLHRAQDRSRDRRAAAAQAAAAPVAAPGAPAADRI